MANSTGCEIVSCREDGRIVRLESQVSSIDKVLDRLDTKMDQVLSAINRVEVLETKHNSATSTLGAALNRIDQIEKSVQGVDAELQASLNKMRGMRLLAWALWSTFGATLLVLVVDRFAG